MHKVLNETCILEVLRTIIGGSNKTKINAEILVNIFDFIYNMTAAHEIPPPEKYEDICLKTAIIVLLNIQEREADSAAILT